MKKLEALRKKETKHDRTRTSPALPNIVHNFSSYNLTIEEHKALSYGLDHYIPDKLDKRRIEVEFENLYQNILWNAKDIGEQEKQNLKTKFLGCFRDYGKINAPYEYKDTVKKLSSNKSICLLKQDKGRGIVIMDRTKYVEKCQNILQSDKFVELQEDPTAKFESRVQKCLRKMKKRLGAVTYNSIYPTASRPGRFYGTAKLHKLDEGCTDINQLPVRPIISNIGTATYKTSKYLAKLLAPLTKSEYTINSTKEFISYTKKLKVGKEYEMISFDVSNLFTNVPLELTIDLILKKVYQKKMIKTKLRKGELKELLEVCTKEMHFTFDGKIYQQTDGVCMGSPLGPVLANVFMVHLEETIVPQLQDHMPTWRRYVDDTFTLVKKGKKDEVIAALNSFHPNIKFTHEVEKDQQIAFLDVMLTKEENGKVQTSVYRKPTNNSIYIHWQSYAPKQWKVGTLSGIIRRAYEICSTDTALKMELSHIKKVFIEINGYPPHLVTSLLKKANEKSKGESNNPEENPEDTNEDPTESKLLMIKVPYAGKTGENIVDSLKNSLKRNLPTNIKCRIVQTGTKLSTRFNIKDAIDKKHLSNFIYRRKCKNKKCKGSYVGETARRRTVRTEEHGGKDKNSWIFKHSSTTKHPRAKDQDFEILATNYGDRRKRKLAEAMFIRDLKPTLNKQKESFKLALFA